jgi:hypothetical protein
MGSPSAYSGTSWDMAMAHESPSSAHFANSLWAETAVMVPCNSGRAFQALRVGESKLEG